MADKETTTVYLRNFPESTRRKIKAAAAMRAQTMSQFIAEACEAYIAEQDKKGGK